MKFGMTKKRVTVVVAAAIVLVAGGGVAYAYWTSTGSGTSQATTGTSTPFTIDNVVTNGDPSRRAVPKYKLWISMSPTPLTILSS